LRPSFINGKESLWKKEGQAPTEETNAGGVLRRGGVAVPNEGNRLGSGKRKGGRKGPGGSSTFSERSAKKVCDSAEKKER